MKVARKEVRRREVETEAMEPDLLWLLMCYQGKHISGRCASLSTADNDRSVFNWKNETKYLFFKSRVQIIFVSFLFFSRFPSFTSFFISFLFSPASDGVSMMRV